MTKIVSYNIAHGIININFENLQLSYVSASFFFLNSPGYCTVFLLKHFPLSVGLKWGSDGGEPEPFKALMVKFRSNFFLTSKVECGK